MFSINNKRKKEHEASPDTAVLEEELPAPEVPPLPPAIAPETSDTSLLAKAMNQVTTTEAALKEAMGAVTDAHTELQSVQLAITNKWEDGAELQELLVRRETLMTLQARAEMQEKSARMAHKAAEGRLVSVQHEIDRYRDALRDHAITRNMILQRIEETRQRLGFFEGELEEHDQRVARIHNDLERLGGKATG